MDSVTLAALAVTRGAILHGGFDNINHPKFFVIVGENDDHLVGFFFINSDIHPSIKSKPAQYEMQMPLRKKDYGFLSYDSYVGASKLNLISKHKVALDIANKNTQIKGNLTYEDMNMLLEAVRKSKLFSKTEKDTFFK